MITKNRGTVLIVEDEFELREILAMLLGEMDVNVLIASNGKQALEVIRDNDVDAVISDINMPLMNGLELLKQVRSDGNEIPFVFVTAYADKSNLLEALRLGAIDFIEKPFKIDSIYEIVEKVVELGISLKGMQKELDSLFRQSTIPVDEMNRMKNMRRAMLMMKMECDIYSRRKMETA